MNRIVEVNAELAYATVEPGVTQGQLAEYLAERGLPVWMDATGAGPNATPPTIAAPTIDPAGLTYCQTTYPHDGGGGI